VTASAPPVDLAFKRLWGAPGQAAIALCGVVASTSLMIAMAVMVTSFRGSVDEWLTQILPADVYLRVDPATGGFDEALQNRLAAAPGVGAISFQKITPLRLSPERPPLALSARDDAESALPLTGPQIAPPAGAVPAWVSEPAARLYGWRPGHAVDLPLTTVAGEERLARVVVAGVWRDYTRQHGAVVIRGTDYRRLTGDAVRTEAAVRLAPGASVDAVSRSLRAALPPALERQALLNDPGRLRAIALRIFDRSFAVTYVLEAIAILVGLAGVAATFSAQTLARAKEFGMLRHIGV